VEAVRVSYPQVAVALAHTEVNNGVLNDEKPIESILGGVEKRIELGQENLATNHSFVHAAR
jgi:hypothetical protein